MISVSTRRVAPISATRFSALLLSTALSPFATSAQTPACPAVVEHPATPADTAYAESRYESAEDLYTVALNHNPQDTAAAIRLIHTLLHEGKVTQAATKATVLVAADPHSATALTALAEVQLRQGEPWLASQTLDASAAADPCNARTHLIRSRVLRIDSMYFSERAELQAAYDRDPNDTDIQHAWLSIVSPAHDVESTSQSLASMKDLDDETRQKAESNVEAVLPMLSETSQTCQVVPGTASATLPLQATMSDARHIDGYRLEVNLPQTKLKLLVDTAASGFYISRAAADQNGFKPSPGDPPGTVRADKIRIGPVELHNCLVGVSETPFLNKGDGFIGTDVFAPWLITLDHRLSKLNLAPLPPQASVLPGNRPTASELAGFTPVYHRRQYLMVPLTFGNSSRKLFILATGMRFSAMTSVAAHSLSKMTVNFTNTEDTAQGTKVQFFREIFDMQLGSLPPIHQGHILEFDPNIVNHNAGFQISGMLGLDVLQPLTLHIDYRDGLVKFENPAAGNAPEPTSNTMIAGAASAGSEPTTCATLNQADRPTNSVIQARLPGGIDSAHLKPGKELWAKVVYQISYPGCVLDEEALVYGHVMEVNSTKGPDSSELAIQFDHADCEGHTKKELPLKLIGLVGPPPESKELHDALPNEVSGGGRQISNAVANSANAFDANLNPGGPPNTIHPGIVVSLPEAKLDPQDGPGCSARITSKRRSVQLGPGSEFILSMTQIQ